MRMKKFGRFRNTLTRKKLSGNTPKREMVTKFIQSRTCSEPWMLFFKIKNSVLCLKMEIWRWSLSVRIV